MKIDKEIIERYHRNECSPEEAQAVELWLFSGDSDEALLLPINEDKAVHKTMIWTDIEKTILPEKEIIPGKTKRTFHKISFWSGAVAASLFIAVLTASFYHLGKNLTTQDQPLLSVNNRSSINVKHLEANAYHISVGPNTSASINNTTGSVDLSGSLLISPKKDIVLSFEGSKEKMTFKAGQTYIILKGEDGNDKIIIVNEKNIMDLPPLLQKQIINEFKI